MIQSLAAYEGYPAAAAQGRFNHNQSLDAALAQIFCKQSFNTG
jgi:hypothetical protein